jgi:uncharacterized membrane protein YphA (DoxX/SURF4 family)
MERFSFNGSYCSRPPQRPCYYCASFRARNIRPADPVPYRNERNVSSVEMNFLLKLTRAHASLARLLDSSRWLFLLLARGYLGWEFWQSGSGLAVALAALVVAGAFTRVGSLTALAWLASGGLHHPSASGGPFDTTLLTVILLTLAVCGAGAPAVDTWLEQRLARLCRPFMAAPPA